MARTRHTSKMQRRPTALTSHSASRGRQAATRLAAAASARQRGADALVEPEAACARVAHIRTRDVGYGFDDLEKPEPTGTKVAKGGVKAGWHGGKTPAASWRYRPRRGLRVPEEQREKEGQWSLGAGALTVVPLNLDLSATQQAVRCCCRRPLLRAMRAHTDVDVRLTRSVVKKKPQRWP